MNTLTKRNNELPRFNYSLLSDEEKLKTLENEKRLEEIFNRYRPEVGEVLYNQQQVLANHHEGVFAEWYKSKGFKRWKVYDYINKYKYVLRISEDSEKLEMFDDIPVSLQSEMAKPSANEELNQKVFDGDITKHKEYKDLEKQLQEKEKAIENLKWHNAQKDEEIQAARNKQEVIKEQVVKEVIPEDYEELKKSNDRMERELEVMQGSVEYAEKQYERLVAQREEVNEKSIKYDRLTEAIESAEGRLDQQQRLVANHKNVLSMLRKANEAIVTASPVIYTDFGDLLQTDTLVNEELDRLVNRTQKLADDLRDLRKESRIIEGEITND